MIIHVLAAPLSRRQNRPMTVPAMRQVIDEEWAAPNQALKSVGSSVQCLLESRQSLRQKGDLFLTKSCCLSIDFLYIIDLLCRRSIHLYHLVLHTVQISLRYKFHVRRFPIRCVPALYSEVTRVLRIRIWEYWHGEFGSLKVMTLWPAARPKHLTVPYSQNSNSQHSCCRR